MEIMKSKIELKVGKKYNTRSAGVVEITSIRMETGSFISTSRWGVFIYTEHGVPAGGVSLFPHWEIISEVED